MNATAKELGVVATLLAEFPAKLPPCCARLLQCSPESFDDLRLGAIACAIRETSNCGIPVFQNTVRERLVESKKIEDAGGALFFDNLLSQALPIGAAEYDAIDLWEAYRKRRVKTVFAEAATSMEADPNQADAIADGVRHSLDFLTKEHRNGSGFTVRKPSEFLTMQFDDSDRILGDRLLALGQSLVIAAAGGTGKSRALFQAAGCIVSGRKFLAFETGGADLRWLILQTENSNRRLRDDLAKLKAWLGDNWAQFEDRVLIHSIETDADSFVSLDNPENVANIAAAIEDAKPNIIAIDPLNDFAIGDLNKDADMKATLQALSRVCRKGNPERSIIVLHHALTGRGGAAKATGYDRSSFARNSKALHAWARGQINLAPVDEDSNERLIVACGKCSNGREFLPFAIRMNPETMIYECDPSVDVAQWQDEINGTKNGQLMTPERVKDLCRNPLSKPELARAIMQDCGCARGTAYRHMDKAERKKAIHYSKASDRYIPK